MESHGLHPEICFVSPSIVDDDVELLSEIRGELGSRFIIMTGPRLPTDLARTETLESDSFFLMTSIHNNHIMPIVSRSSLLVTQAFDPRGYSALEAKAASVANRSRELGHEILGILLDENGYLDPGRRHHYPLACDEQIEAEVVTCKNDIIPMIEKCSADSF